MFPFQVTMQIDPETSLDHLGVVRVKTSRKTGALYAAINLGGDWDFHTRASKRGVYANEYGVGLIAIASYLRDNLFDNFEVFGRAYLKNPDRFPSFTLKVRHFAGSGTLEPWDSYEFDFDEETLTLEELNRLMAFGNGALRIW